MLHLNFKFNYFNYKIISQELKIYPDLTFTKKDLLYYDLILIILNFNVF